MTDPRFAAAPLVVRHLEAYTELIACELGGAGRRLRRDCAAALLLAVALLVLALIACACVVASTWDTPDRLLALYLLLCPFALVALVTGGYLARSKATPNLLPLTFAEWQKDRAVIADVVGKFSATHL